MEKSPATVAMVFAGGLGLAAYHAGAYQAFSRRSTPLHWVAGSSAGAVTAALIAGNRSEKRIERLRAFCNFPPPENYRPVAWRHLYGWIGALGTRLIGSRGHFHPRMPSMDPFVFRSLYDLSPMRERIESLIDFDRLNSGETRISVAATDIDGDGLSTLQEFLAGTDPTDSVSAFRIRSVSSTGGDVLISWMTGIGKTNTLQWTAGVGDGNYQTDNYTDIFTVTNALDTMTNYLDIGGATNVPAKYYRVRLVP